MNIHRIVGFGKKSENYDKMTDKRKKISNTIKQMRKTLKKPLQEVEKIEKDLVKLYWKERKLREKSSIESGKRVLSDEKSMVELKQCETQINSCIRKKKKIESQHKEDFKKLRKNMNEEERIRLKAKIYKIDTELDQIMTCFKLSFANLCSLFLSECMNHERHEMQTLFESIFALDGKALITETDKIIKLNKNPKEPKVMKKLEDSIKRLNGMNVRNLDGRKLQFSI